MAEKASSGLQPVCQEYTSIEVVAFITVVLGHHLAGNFSSHISRGSASEELQVVCVGGLQAAINRAVIQCWV